MLKHPTHHIRWASSDQLGSVNLRKPVNQPNRWSMKRAGRQFVVNWFLTKHYFAFIRTKQPLAIKIGKVEATKPTIQKIEQDLINWMERHGWMAVCVIKISEKRTHTNHTEGKENHSWMTLCVIKTAEHRTHTNHTKSGERHGWMGARTNGRK